MLEREDVDPDSGEKIYRTPLGCTSALRAPMGGKESMGEEGRGKRQIG